jgi:hypothetical protein
MSKKANDEASMRPPQHGRLAALKRRVNGLDDAARSENKFKEENE